MGERLIEIPKHISPFHHCLFAHRRSNHWLHLLPPSNPKELGTVTHGKCPMQGCYQSCIAPDCGCQLCRRHCQEAGGCSSKNHPPKAPSVMAPVAPPMVIPPLLLQSTAPVPLGPIAHPLLSGHGLTIPSSQQLPLHHSLPVSPADSSFHWSKVEKC